MPKSFKQSTKAQFEKGVRKRGSEPFGKFDVTPRSAIDAVSATLLSAIRRGFDKIRINDQLHVRIKKVKGGRVRTLRRDAHTASFESSQPEYIQLPDRYVISLVHTPDLKAALDERAKLEDV